MASLKELKDRIGSVKSTQKITKAKQMVAAAKLRRAQASAEAARPYAERMSAVMASLAGKVSGEGAPKLLAGNGSDQRHMLVVAGVVAAYFGVMVVGAAALTMGGHAAVDAIFESASALGTVGLSSGVTSSALPAWQKAVLMFEMWAGRLEIIVVLALLHPRTWLPSGRS